MILFFFFQAEDGIRDLVRSRGLGYVYKRQYQEHHRWRPRLRNHLAGAGPGHRQAGRPDPLAPVCLLYTSDAADDLLCVELGGRRIIKKKRKKKKKRETHSVVAICTVTITPKWQ